MTSQRSTDAIQAPHSPASTNNTQKRARPLSTLSSPTNLNSPPLRRSPARAAKLRVVASRAAADVASSVDIEDMCTDASATRSSQRLVTSPSTNDAPHAVPPALDADGKYVHYIVLDIELGQSEVSLNGEKVPATVSWRQ